MKIMHTSSNEVAPPVVKRRYYGPELKVQVVQECRQAAHGTAEVDGLERLAVAHAAADVEDQGAQRCAHRHFHDAAVYHMTRQRDRLPSP